MKSLKYLILSFSVALLAGCSSDAPEPSPDNGESKGDVYARLTLSLPTRSETVEGDDNSNSDNGYEVGSETENNVAEVLVVLATADPDGKDYKYVTCALSDARLNANLTKPAYVVQFQSRALNALVEKEAMAVNVFAYCNPTPALKAFFLNADNSAKSASEVGSFVNQVLSIAAPDQSSETDVIWNPNHFLMTNSSLHKATIPDLQTLVAEHNTAATALNLKTVRVKRACSRFDFASITTEAGVNRYVINDLITEAPAAVIELDALALMNEAKSFYALPRVSANGQNVDFSLCGLETPTNWVVSPYAVEKAANPVDYNLFEDKFIYPLGLDASAPNSYKFTPFSAFVGVEDKDDNDDNGTWTDPDNLDYYVWRYCTENTIPHVDNQQRGLTTGVIFRGEIKPYVPKEGEALSPQATLIREAMEKGKVLYAYKGVLFGDADDVRNAAKHAPGTTFEVDFDKAFSPANVDANGNLKMSSNGFSIYRPTGAEGNYHYYCYYYYYNRHNDNGDNTVMGPMEFGVVRNNIYKLSVTSILQYGHPGKPGDDDDPDPKPDPDEDKDAYFRMSIQVVPWVVRINDIEFQ